LGSTGVNDCLDKKSSREGGGWTKNLRGRKNVKMQKTDKMSGIGTRTIGERNPARKRWKGWGGRREVERGKGKKTKKTKSWPI